MEGAAEAEHVVVGGVANIAAEETFHRRETLRQVYEALERESAILRLLREAAATPLVSVMIGRENPVPEMWEASVIAAPSPKRAAPENSGSTPRPTMRSRADRSPNETRTLSPTRKPSASGPP